MKMLPLSILGSCGSWFPVSTWASQTFSTEQTRAFTFMEKGNSITIPVSLNEMSIIA